MIEINENNKTELNVLTMHYLPWTSLRNIGSNCGQFFRNLKYAYQRIVYGYCDPDTWDLDSYYLRLFYHTLKHLAKNTVSYPGIDEFSDEKGGFDAWQKYISDMADHFEKAEEWNESTSMNQQVLAARDKMEQYLDSTEFVPCNDGSNCSTLKYHYNDENAYKQAQKEWLDLETQAGNYREIEKNIGLDMMKDYFFHLWD